MAYLNEIIKYKNTIAERLITNMDLCKALFYGETNFLDQPDIDDTSSLMYTQIFPYRFVPESSSDHSVMKPYITIYGMDFKLSSPTIKRGLIYFEIFSHRLMFNSDYGCTRTDFIANKIDEMMNFKRDVGIGRLEFYSMDEIAINEKYQGIRIGYKPVDFNVG